MDFECLADVGFIYVKTSVTADVWIGYRDSMFILPQYFSLSCSYFQAKAVCRIFLFVNWTSNYIENITFSYT